jgi:hypothetical protein
MKAFTNKIKASKYFTELKEAHKLDDVDIQVFDSETGEQKDK